MSNQNNVKFIPFPDEDQDENQDATVISEEVSREILLNNISSALFVRLPYSMTLLFDSATALFLSYLIQSTEPYNVAEKKIDKKGFFMCRRTYIKSKIGISPTAQERIIYSLVEKNLIQYEVRNGMPPSGWIKLNYKEINEYINKTEKKDIN